MRLIWLPAAAFALLACCSNPEKPVARVGDYLIRQKDVDYRNQVIRFYFPGDDRKLGLQQLTRAYTSAQILKNNGHEITAKALAQEEARIEKNTLQPDRLAQIKAIFGDDHESYRRDYVLPVYAERVIYYDFFAHDPRIQEESLNLAKRLISEARRSHRSLNEVARSHELSAGHFTVSLAEGVQWKLPAEMTDVAVQQMQKAQDPELQAKLDERKAAQESEEGKRWIQEIIKPLKPGEVSTQVIDRQESWLVARYIGKKGKDTYLLEAVAVPKANYENWLETESAKIQVTLMPSK